LEEVSVGDGSAVTVDGPAPGGNPEIFSEYAFSE
jgi:hypothetical protein